MGCPSDKRMGIVMPRYEQAADAVVQIFEKRLIEVALFEVIGGRAAGDRVFVPSLGRTSPIS